MPPEVASRNSSPCRFPISPKPMIPIRFFMLVLLLVSQLFILLAIRLYSIKTFLASLILLFFRSRPAVPRTPHFFSSEHLMQTPFVRNHAQLKTFSVSC